jgi:signal transduction histidine kinase
MKPPTQKNERILVIDDNQAIRADFKKILQPDDEWSPGMAAAVTSLFGPATNSSRPSCFELDAAPSGEEGLARVREAVAEGRPYAVAFVDVRMPPGWDGIETTARIWKYDPDIQIIICTAYSDYSWDEMIKKLGQSDRLVILKKPFDTVEVLQLAHALSEKWELGQKVRARVDQLEAMVATRTRELQAANEQLKVEMAERARTEEELRQAQKMEAVGQLAGGIAHDFNNLLTVIQGYLECLTAEMNQSASVAEALHEIDAAAKRAAKLTAQMLMFSRKKPIRPQNLNLNEMVTQFRTMVTRVLGESITLEIQTDSQPLTIRADPVMIEMVLLNMALNARDAMPKGGRLVIGTSKIELPPQSAAQNGRARTGRFAVICVQDTGCGIAPEALAHLFEPFFTTKEAGKGTGLGLASAYGIVKQHEGWIEVASEPGQGACFKIFLPVEDKAVTPETPVTTISRKAGGNETILLVEDEKPVCRLAKALLQRQGYRVYDASSGAEALAIWQERRQEIDLLFTDMIMPGGMTGRELAEKIAADRPDLKIIYTTGYSPDEFRQSLTLQEGINFLPKPYNPDKLIRTIRHCLDEVASAPRT